VSAAVVVLIGFGRTYYAKSLFGMPTLSPLFHIHGALFTAWMIFLIFQSYLVASRRTALHRKTGWIGGILAVLMLITGCMAAVAAARGQAPITGAVMRGELKMRVPALGLPRVQSMIVPLATMVLFGGFTGAGVVFRRKPDVHKRCMMLATIAMLPAAIGRGMAALFGVAQPGVFFGAVALFIIAIGIYDRRSLGRVHPVTLWGGLGIMLSFPGRLAFAKTDLWLRFAEWMVN
jgi:hypothetical protein